MVELQASDEADDRPSGKKTSRDYKKSTVLDQEYAEKNSVLDKE
jgi:hypothetical protein